MVPKTAFDVLRCGLLLFRLLVGNYYLSINIILVGSKGIITIPSVAVLGVAG